MVTSDHPRGQRLTRLIGPLPAPECSRFSQPIQWPTRWSLTRCEAMCQRCIDLIELDKLTSTLRHAAAMAYRQQRRVDASTMRRRRGVSKHYVPYTSALTAPASSSHPPAPRAPTATGIEHRRREESGEKLTHHSPRADQSPVKDLRERQPRRRDGPSYAPVTKPAVRESATAAEYDLASAWTKVAEGGL